MPLLMLKPFIMKDKEDQYVCLLLKPEEGSTLNKTNLDILVPMIKKLVENQNVFNAIVDNISVINNEIVFNNIDSKDTIEKIKYLCHQKMSEKLIVQQDMGSGPSIRHRPLYFGCGEKNSLVIKYTTLGEFNSIDVAINQLKSYGY